jgi:putative transposase
MTSLWVTTLKGSRKGRRGMSTYTQIYYHITFGPYERRPCLCGDRREEFFKFAWGVIKQKKCTLYRINAVDDHLHMLVSIHPTVTLSDFVLDFKKATNRWIKENNAFPGFEHWQEGYGGFTHSRQERDGLIEYIKGQQEHHKHESFRDEFRRLLDEAGIEYDERYLP